MFTPHFWKLPTAYWFPSRLAPPTAHRLLDSHSDSGANCTARPSISGVMRS